MLISGHPTSGEELRRQDLHVPGQHHEIDVAAQQVELTTLRLVADLLGRRDVHERHAERPDLVGEIGMVRDHHHHRHVQLTAAVAPQQIEQAVIFLRRHDRDPFGFAASVSRKSIPNGSATCSAKSRSSASRAAVRPGR